MDDNNQRRSLLNNHPFRGRSISPGFPCLKDVFPVGVSFSKDLHRGELDGLETLFFGFFSLFWTVFLLHTYLLESTDMFLCTSYALSTVSFPLPLDLLLAAAAPSACDVEPQSDPGINKLLSFMKLSCLHLSHDQRFFDRPRCVF